MQSFIFCAKKNDVLPKKLARSSEFTTVREFVHNRQQLAKNGMHDVTQMSLF